MKRLSSKAIAFLGIGSYVLGVVASAEDAGGNPLLPPVAIAASELLSLLFVVLATVRLWSRSKFVALALPLTELARAVVPMLLPAAPDVAIILAWNLTKVVSFAVFVWAIILLLRSGQSAGPDDESRSSVRSVLAAIALPLVAILGLVLHVWTIGIAFTSAGLVPAIISALAPALAQLYWAFMIWKASGTFANPYCLAIVAYLVLAGAGLSAIQGDD